MWDIGAPLSYGDMGVSLDSNVLFTFTEDEPEILAGKNIRLRDLDLEQYFN